MKKILFTLYFLLASAMGFADGIDKVHVYDNDSYNYLHMNWGMNGNSNGYYYAEPGDESFFYDEYQLNFNLKIITDIH